MPVIQGMDRDGTYYRYNPGWGCRTPAQFWATLHGKTGKKYYFITLLGGLRAYKKAERQGRAIQASKRRR